MAERGELGTDVEVEDMELVEPILVVALDEEAGEEADPVLNNCCGPLFEAESSSCLVHDQKFSFVQNFTPHSTNIS